METESEKRRQIVARIEDMQTWRDFRSIAVQKGLRVGELLEYVMSAYIEQQRAADKAS